MWLLQIQDPSGETRALPVPSAPSRTLIGRTEAAEISLRDPSAPSEALIVQMRDWAESTQQPQPRSPFWITVPDGAPPCRLGDFAIREAQLPTGIPLMVGETRITLVESEASAATQPEQPHGLRPWLTRSKAGAKLLWTARKAAATPLSLYLAGETGTGKEVIAHLLHAWSTRAAGPFVPLHCGALALSLAESELFGHVKGAFTGAIQHRPGALMQAHNGTLFLDEVGDLPMDIQVKLLRFLENGEIRPVGADRSSRADVRILCATHHPLLKLVEEGKFRRDLYYRLASVTLEISSLRERPEDIELLAERFAADLDKTISPRALLRLMAHRWPGNVRELRHAVERAAGLAGPFSPVLTEESFDFLLHRDSVASSPALELGAPVLTLREMERVLLLRALALAHGNRRKAASILGVARSTLFEMLKRHKIQGPRFMN